MRDVPNSISELSPVGLLLIWLLFVVCGPLVIVCGVLIIAAKHLRYASRVMVLACRQKKLQPPVKEEVKEVRILVTTTRKKVEVNFVLGGLGVGERPGLSWGPTGAEFYEQKCDNPAEAIRLIASNRERVELMAALNCNSNERLGECLAEWLARNSQQGTMK